MTTLLIILGVVMAIIWVAKRLKPMLSIITQSKSQVSFLNAYLKYSTTSADWVFKCSDKKDLLVKGQERLWDTVEKFNANLDKLAKNGFKVHKDDTEMLEQALAIVTTVHLMHAAEKGDIKFNYVQTTDD